MSKLSNYKYLFEPWKAPEETLKASGIILGKTYPKPIVDWSTSRKAALDKFYQI
jgi:deoxyribodipyrimidine photo-lyase